jgi:hypothetical protein
MGRALRPLPRKSKSQFSGLGYSYQCWPPRYGLSPLDRLRQQWRPETLTIHLPCGEMSVLMEDIGYILGRCLDSPAVTGTIEPLNWKDMVE